MTQSKLKYVKCLNKYSKITKNCVCVCMHYTMCRKYPKKPGSLKPKLRAVVSIPALVLGTKLVCFATESSLQLPEHEQKITKKLISALCEEMLN